MEDPLANIDTSSNKKVIIWRVISLILFIFLVTVGVLYALGIGYKKYGNFESELTLWNSNSAIYTKLVPYIRNITDKSNKDFIPVEDRIAVFDLDGTLFCETDPIYFDWNMFTYRVLDDPNYTAEQQDKDLAYDIRAADIHHLPDNIEEKHSVRNPYVFKGMKMEEYVEYTKKFLDQEAPGYTNMKRGDAFYKPMIEVVNYLQKNDFQVFIVSG